MGSVKRPIPSIIHTTVERLFKPKKNLKV